MQELPGFFYWVGSGKGGGEDQGDGDDDGNDALHNVCPPKKSDRSCGNSRG